MQAVTEAALQVVLRRVLSQYVVSAERASDGVSVSAPSPATPGSGGEQHGSGYGGSESRDTVGSHNGSSSGSGSGSGGGGVEQLRVQLKNGAVVLRHLELNLQSVLSLDPRRMRVHRAYAHALHVRVPNVFNVKEMLSDPYVVTLEGVELKLEVSDAESVASDARSRSNSASSADTRRGSDAAAAGANHSTTNGGEVKRLMGNVVRGILTKLARVCGEVRGLRVSILHNGNEFILSIGTVKLLEAEDVSMSAATMMARDGPASAAATTTTDGGDDMDDSMFGRAMIIEGLHMSVLLSHDKREGLLQCASLRCTALVPTDEHMDQLADDFEDSIGGGNTGDAVYGRCAMDVSMSPLAVTASFLHMRAVMSMIRAMRKDDTTAVTADTASRAQEDLHRVERSTRTPSASLTEPHVTHSPGGSTVWSSLSSVVVPPPETDSALSSGSGSVVSNQNVPEAPSVPLRLTSRICILSGDVTILRPSPSVHSVDLVWNELTIDKTCESPSVFSCISVRLDASIVSKLGETGDTGVSSQSAFDFGADASGNDRWRLRKDRKPTRVTVCNFDGRHGNPGLRFKMEPETFDLDSIMRLDTVSGQIGYPSGFYGHVMAAWRESTSTTSGTRGETRHASATGRSSVDGDASSKRVSNLLDIVSHLRHQLDAEAKSNETMQGEIAVLTQKLYFAEDQLMKAEKMLLSSTRAANAANTGLSISIGTTKASDLSFDIEEGSGGGSKSGTPSKSSFKPLTALARPLLYCLPQRVVAILVIPILRLVDSFSSRLSEMLNRPVMRLSVFLYFLAMHLVLFSALYVGLGYLVVGADDESGKGGSMRMLQRALQKVSPDATAL